MLRAFLKALDDQDAAGSRAGQGAEPPPVAQAPTPLPLGPVIEALQVRVADLEAKVSSMKTYVDSEVDGARRQVERVRSAQRRFELSLEVGGGELEPGQDVPGGDVPAGEGSGVFPLHGRMESSQPTPEEIREAARRALR